MACCGEKSQLTVFVQSCVCVCAVADAALGAGELPGSWVNFDAVIFEQEATDTIPANRRIPFVIDLCHESVRPLTEALSALSRIKL